MHSLLLTFTLLHFAAIIYTFYSTTFLQRSVTFSLHFLISFPLPKRLPDRHMFAVRREAFSNGRPAPGATHDFTNPTMATPRPALQ